MRWNNKHFSSFLKGFFTEVNKVMFLDGESPTLKTFNNNTIIMTNNSDKIRILWVWSFYLCCLTLSQFSRLLWWILCCFQTFWKSWERKDHLRWNKKRFFLIFKGLSIKQIKQVFLEGESPTLNIFLIFPRERNSRIFIGLYK